MLDKVSLTYCVTQALYGNMPDQLQLIQIEGLDSVYYTVIPEDMNYDRMYYDDSRVFIGNGQDDPFLPTRERSGGWYCGDEVHEVCHTFEDNDNMCIPEVKVIRTLSDEEYDYLIARIPDDLRETG